MVRRGSRVRVSFRALSRSPVAIALSLGVLAFAVPAAQAARPLTTGLMDAQYGILDPAVEEGLFDSSAAAGAQLAKIGVSWRGVAVGVPADPSDPSDPAYDFANADLAVRDAAARGIEPILMLTAAPDYAEATDRPPDAIPGTWKPSPGAFAAFGRAVARRYSGSFAGLPRVTYYQAWNEPNLPGHLSPQYEGDQPAAAAIYRDLLNAFYDAVKTVNPANVVVTAGTAPYGDPTGAGRTQPLPFWRDVLCLNLVLKPTACPVKPRFDVLAHNPINTVSSPPTPPDQPEDLTVGNFAELGDLLRAAERHQTIATPGRHPLWATELWWETKPPDNLQGIPPRTQARWLAQSLHLLWRAGASAVIYLSARDGAFQPGDYTAVSSAGLFYEDGTAKPALRAFRFPFVSARAKHQKLIAWGRTPLGGRVRIRAKAAGQWETVERVRAAAGDVFTARLPADAGRRFRAVVGDEKSLVWRRG
jgi:hypothetical protein